LIALGFSFIAVGIAAALAAEGILLAGSLSGRWSIVEAQRNPAFTRWILGGLALVLVGAVIGWMG
jgi:hypothetical protein